MSETENTNGKDEQDSYVAPKMNLSNKMKDKLDDAGKKYPIWNPKTKGECVGGLVENVEFLEHLNQNNGGYIIRILNAENNKFVTFPNKVMVKKLLNLCPTGELAELVGKNVIIQFIDEKQPQDNRLKPYKTYEVIEDN